MKALSLTQPWASLMVLKRNNLPGFLPPVTIKHLETRSWTDAHRGLLAIHASKTYPGWARAFTFDLYNRFPLVRALLHQHGYNGLHSGTLPLGEIVGLRYLTGIFKTDGSMVRKHFALYGYEQMLGDYTPGRFAWRMDPDPSTILSLPQPIQCRGAQKLWTVPDSVEQMICEQLGETLNELIAPN